MLRPFVFVPLPQPAEHHSGRQDRGHRIADPLAGDIRGRAVRRLKYSRILTDIPRRRHAHPPHQAGGQIRDDIPVHILHHHHVERLRSLHHVKRQSVDVRVFLLHLRIAGSHLVEEAPEEGHRAKDIRLVHAGHLHRLLAPLPRQFKGVARQPLRPGAGDHHRVHRHLVAQLDAAVHRSEQSFHVFAQNHQVDLPGPQPLQRRVLGRVQVDRPHPGVQIQLKTQIDLRPHLRAVRPAHVRQPHRPQQHRIGRPAGLHRLLRQRVPPFQVTTRPARMLLKAEGQLPLALQSPQHLHRLIYYFRPNSIPLHHRNFISSTIHPISPP